MCEHILEILKLIHSHDLIVIHIEHHVDLNLVVMYLVEFIFLRVKFFVLLNVCLVFCPEHLVFIHDESFRLFSL